MNLFRNYHLCQSTSFSILGANLPYQWSTILNDFCQETSSATLILFPHSSPTFNRLRRNPRAARPNPLDLRLWAKQSLTYIVLPSVYSTTYLTLELDQKQVEPRDTYHIPIHPRCLASRLCHRHYLSFLSRINQLFAQHLSASLYQLFVPQLS